MLSLMALLVDTGWGVGILGLGFWVVTVLCLSRHLETTPAWLGTMNLDHSLRRRFP